MKVLAVGDVHGCHYTLSHLIEHHWNPKNEFLVLVGDLINKGPHPALCVKLMRNLQKNYPFQVFVLKGNHEDRYLKYHDSPGKSKSIAKTRTDFIKKELNLKKLNNWLKGLPYKWETPHILITHAGISATVKNPYSYTNPRGVLHNRSALRNIGKVQVYGHMIQTKGKVAYSESADAWCIDTGAWIGKNLSAIKLTHKGRVKEVIQIQTFEKDLIKS